MTVTDRIRRIEAIAIYLEHKVISSQALEMWADDLSFVPLEAWEHIENALKQSGWPKGNFPGTCRALFQEWLRLHPDKYTRGPYQDCPDCRKGWLEMENAKGYRYAAPCAKCRQVEGEPRDNYQTLSALLERGYRPHWTMEA